MANDRNLSFEFRSGDRFGAYEILRVAGSGGMGSVYEAIEHPLGRRVALKIVHGGAPSSPESLQRFLVEAKALASLDHPSIVALYGFGEIDGVHYMAMEFVEGIPLDEFINSTAYSIFDALDIFRQIGEGIRVAHEREFLCPIYT